MNYAKSTSAAALAALLMLGAPAFAQTSSPGDSSPAGASSSSESGTTESPVKDQAPALNNTTMPSTTMPGEGRNTTIDAPGDTRATGSGNTPTDRRDCTNPQTPC